MDYKEKGGISRETNAEGRREYGKRPRISAKRSQPVHNSRGYSEKVDFNDDYSHGERNRRPSGGHYGERRQSGYGDRRTSGYGERRSEGYGERRNEGYGERRKSSYGDRRNDGYSDRRADNYGDRRKGVRVQQHPKPKKTPKPAVESGINRMIRRKQQIDYSAYSDNDMVTIPVKDVIRLNRFIANSGICSRREADNFIQAGVVTVNGEVVTELGIKVNIRTDDVRFNGERLKGEEKVYIVLNKPKGYVTTVSDPHVDKTVMELLTGCQARVFPVGRLDKNTTGVLMLTNDGEMAEKLTHPSYNKKKIYQVTLGSKLKQEDFDKIMSGVMLTDGEIAADELEYIDENDHRKIGIEIHSGKNRIVRRIFETLGYDVKALDRVYFAGLTKKNLKRGRWRFLTEGEVNLLRMGAYN